MIHHVFANKSNVGDWLSARGIQSLLGPFAVAEHLCDAPFSDETIMALSGASSDDLIVVGGGGLFMSYFMPFWEGFERIAEVVPFYLWGIGFCDLKSEPSLPPLDRLRGIVERSRLCVVRDELSRALLAPLAIGAPVVCPSLCSIAEPALPGHGLLHVDNYTTAGALVYERMETLGREFAAASGRPFLRTNNRITPASEIELARVLELYRRADLVISSALHGCVIAVAMGRRVVAVSGDRKIEGFMEAAGLREWVLEVGEVDELPARLASIGAQPSRGAFVEGARADNRRVARQVLEAARLSAAASGDPRIEGSR